MITFLALTFLSKAQNNMVRYVCVEYYGEKPEGYLALEYRPNGDKFKYWIQGDEKISLKTLKRRKINGKNSYKLEMRPRTIKHADNTLYITMEGDYIKAKVPISDEELSEVKLVFKKETK